MSTPHSSPYNPNVLQAFTDRMLDQTEALTQARLDAGNYRPRDGGVVVDRVISKSETAPCPDVTVREASVGMGGLLRNFADRLSPEARAERAKQRAYKIHAMGEQLRDPRDDILDPQQAARQRIGWPGTYKDTIAVSTRQADRLLGGRDSGADKVTVQTDTTESSDGVVVDSNKVNFEKAGVSLMWGDTKAPVPNTNRPTTGKEIRAERKMATNLERYYKAMNKATWLAESYENLSEINSRSLSNGEKLHQKTITRQVQKLHKKADKHLRRFYKTRGVLPEENES